MTTTKRNKYLGKHLEYRPMNLFPSGPFKCKCGGEAGHCLALDEDNQLYHTLTCPSCGLISSANTLQELFALWFCNPKILDEKIFDIED